MEFAFLYWQLGATFCQGLMIGRVILGLETGLYPWLFAVAVGICLPFGYSLLGATWLILKAEGDLQKKAVVWAKKNLLMTGICILLISVATPYVSERLFEKWFSYPNIFFLSPIPILTLLLFYRIYQRLNQVEAGHIHNEWLPFLMTIGLFLLSFSGIAYSLFPYLVLDRIDIWEAASASEALWMIFWGTVLVLPAILAYTFFTYRIFWGKTQEKLKYY